MSLSLSLSLSLSILRKKLFEVSLTLPNVKTNATFFKFVHWSRRKKLLDNRRSHISNEQLPTAESNARMTKYLFELNRVNLKMKSSKTKKGPGQKPSGAKPLFLLSLSHTILSLSLSYKRFFSLAIEKQLCPISLPTTQTTPPHMCVVQCDQIWRNFATWAKVYKSLANFWWFISYLAKYLSYFGKFVTLGLFSLV